jgi:co-chaperonin GroES (HSP10)
METIKQIRTLRDIVLIELHLASEVTKGGLIIPVSGRKTRRGIVRVIGKGTIHYEMKLKVGEEVCFHEGSGIPVIKNGKDHLLLREMECFAVEQEAWQDRIFVKEQMKNDRL